MKQRRIPGPAGQNAHDDATSSCSSNHQQANQTQFFSFQSLDSWKAMMSSLGMTNGSDSNRTIITQIADIHRGLCDEHGLRVPLMTAVIEQAQLSEGTWILNMKDESGEIIGFLPIDAAKINPNILCKHSSVVLQKVSLFISKEVDFTIVEATEHGRGRSRFKRYLNLHKNCISAVFTAAMLLDCDGGGGSSGLPHVNNGSCSNGSTQGGIGMEIPAECSYLPVFPLTRSPPSSAAAAASAAATAAVPAAMSVFSEDYSAFHFPSATTTAIAVWDVRPSERGEEDGQLAAAPKRKRAVD